ncbi:MAG: hypothetical protein KBS62_04875 [Oscillospiraceae bacterium]|nr:hypothetical protein [Candidatus Ruminococcus equi]
MDDISAKIGEILSDPEALKQIEELSSMLGKSDLPSVHKEPPPPKNDFSSLFQNNDTMKMLSKIVPIMQSIKEEDDTTRLLFAIRPFLSEKRQKKLDEATKILKMMKLLPLLKDFNLIDKLF